MISSNNILLNYYLLTPGHNTHEIYDIWFTTPFPLQLGAVEKVTQMDR